MSVPTYREMTDEKLDKQLIAFNSRWGDRRTPVDERRQCWQEIAKINAEIERRKVVRTFIRPIAQEGTS